MTLRPAGHASLVGLTVLSIVADEGALLARLLILCRVVRSSDFSAPTRDCSVSVAVLVTSAPGPHVLIDALERAAYIPSVVLTETRIPMNRIVVRL